MSTKSKQLIPVISRAASLNQLKLLNSRSKNILEQQTIVSFEIDIEIDEQNKDKIKSEIIFHCTTLNGNWRFRKLYSDVWEFVATINTKYGKTELLRQAIKQSKIQSEFLKGNNEKLIEYLKEIFSIIGENKTMINDKLIFSFLGPKDVKIITDIKSGRLFNIDRKENYNNNIKIEGDNNNKHHRQRRYHHENNNHNEKLNINEHENENENGNINFNKKEKEEQDQDQEQEQQEQQKQKQKQKQHKKENHRNEDDERNLIQEIAYLRQQIRLLTVRNETIERERLQETTELKNKLSIAQSDKKAAEDHLKTLQNEFEELKTDNKILRKKLGHDDFGLEIKQLFPELIFTENQNEDQNLVEKYYQQTKEQEKTIRRQQEELSRLATEIQNLRKANTRLDTVAASYYQALFEAKHVETLKQLKDDLVEAEAEIDQLMVVNEQYHQKLEEAAKIIDNLQQEKVKMLPNYEQYPLLETKIIALEKQMMDIQEESIKLCKQRDDYEKRWILLRDRDVIPKQQHDKIIKQIKQDVIQERKI